MKGTAWFLYSSFVAHQRQLDGELAEWHIELLMALQIGVQLHVALAGCVTNLYEKKRTDESSIIVLWHEILVVLGSLCTERSLTRRLS